MNILKRFLCFMCISFVLQSGQACLNCFNNTCTDGRCIDGCNNGYFGRNCSSLCRAQCLNSTCELSLETGSAICSNQCVNGWYGDNCELRCSRRCVACNSTKCFRCESHRYYGPQCRRYCFHCPSYACHRNGTCKYPSDSNTIKDKQQRNVHPALSTEDTRHGGDVSVYNLENKPTSSINTTAVEDVELSDVTSGMVISPSKQLNVTSSCFIAAGFGSLILISTFFIVLRHRGRRHQCPGKIPIQRSIVDKMECIYDEIEALIVGEIQRRNIEYGVYITPLFEPRQSVSGTELHVYSQAYDVAD